MEGVTQLAPAGENHRTKNGRVRRERMIKHLLASVKSVCSGRGNGGPAVIDDVVSHASVSRGTFYKYFNSLEDAISEVAQQLVDDMVTEIMPFYGELADPVVRTATGFQFYLARAIIDHDWGGFVTHLGLLSEGQVRSLIKSDMQHGHDAGGYAIKSVDVAVDLLMGVKIEAIRRIIADNRGTRYMRGMTEMVLISLGAPQAQAEAAVISAYDRLRQITPSDLEWWRPLE